MPLENTLPEQIDTCWMIDMEWYVTNNRSFFELACRSLCQKCSEKMAKKKRKPAAGETLAAIKDCCGKTPEFITNRMPILESIFRVMLANGNKPLTIREISSQLRERRDGDAYVSSPVLINRLLTNDKWYGFKPVQN